MRILSLELENTKSYATGKIEFTDGVNAIVGHNGAGKSTVLEAIGFTLFDSLTGYKQSDFVREGTKSAEVKVTVLSGLDDRTYQVVRRCGSSNHHAIYDPDLGNKICEGKADVLHFLRQHMGVDLTADLTRLFSDAVGVPQGTFTAAFLQTPAQRKSIFDPLLQVEEYKSAFDKLLDPLRTLQQQNQELAIAISSHQGRLERLEPLKTSIAERTKALTQLGEENSTVKARLTKVQDARIALDAIQQQLTSLRTEQQRVEQRQATLGAQLQSAERAKQEAKEAAQIVETNEPDHQCYITAQERQKVLEAAVRARQQLERQRSDIDKESSIRRAELARTLQDLEAIATAETQIAALAPAIQEQEEIESAYQAAQQNKARLETAQSQLQTAQETYQRQQKRLTKLETQLAQVTALDDERVAQERSSDEIRVRLDQAKERLLHFKVEADALKEQSKALAEIDGARCPVCEQPLTATHRHTLAERNQSRIDTLRSDYRIAQQQIKTNEGELAAIQERLKAIQQSLRTMPREDERIALQQELESLQSVILAHQEQISEYREAPAITQELQNRLRQLGDPKQERAVAQATIVQRPAIEKAQGEAEAKLSELQQRHQSVQTALSEYDNLDTELENVNATVQRTLQGYQQVLRYQQIASSLPQREAEIVQLERESEVIEDQLSAIQHQISAIDAQFDKTNYQQLLADEQNLRDRQNVVQTELTFLQREQSRAEAELTELQQIETALLDTLQAQENIRQKTEVLEALRNLLRQAGPYITKALIKQISDGAMQVFSDIMQDYTRHLTWNEDYGITLEVDGRERQFAQLSGGEQMTAALAVRLALLREMSSIDVAFFDEPTTNLDEARRDALARQILEVKGFRQLFVISHDDTFEQATQNLIRIARVNGISTVQQS